MRTGSEHTSHAANLPEAGRSLRSKREL